LSFLLPLLTIYHKAPTSQDSIAQSVEKKISGSPWVDTREELVGRWKASPEVSMGIAIDNDGGGLRD